MRQTLNSNLCSGAQDAPEACENTYLFPRVLFEELSFPIHLKPPLEADCVPITAQVTSPKHQHF